MDMARLIARNPDLTFRNLAEDEGGVLLNVETTAYFRLNQIGSLIWQRLEEPSSMEELVAHVRTRVDDPPDHVARDVEVFVEQMVASDLVSVVQAPTPPTRSGS